jgi:hypothetical protein
MRKHILSPIRSIYPGSKSAVRFNLRILKHLGLPVDEAIIEVDGQDKVVKLLGVEWDFLSQSRLLQTCFGLSLEKGHDSVVGQKQHM